MEVGISPPSAGRSLFVFVALALLLSWVPALLLSFPGGVRFVHLDRLAGTPSFWIVAVAPLLAVAIARLVAKDSSPCGFSMDLPVRWIAVALVLPGLWVAGVIILGESARLSAWPYPRETGLSAAGLSLRTTAAVGLPLALVQEAAWRGYLLPRLLARGRIEASLIVGLIWAACTLPWLYLIWPYGEAHPVLGTAAHILQIILLSLLMTWLYTRSRRSLIVCVLAHAMLWTFAGTITGPGHLDGMPILVGARGILGSMFLVLWAWLVYLRGGLR
ncbi:MAG: CPBP family intramembrane metalloprotease [Candidatus Eisenbacteria sp.]|nr:CPBP family intramembrane metalloprotease [Candidatus Eisenbacteria bacterium]